MNTVEFKRRKRKRIQKRIVKKKAQSSRPKKTLKTRVKKSTRVLLVLMLVYFVYKYISVEMQYQNLVKQRDELKATIESTQRYQEDLLKQVENNQSEEYIEDLARRYLGLVYPDERIFREVEAESLGEQE